MSAGGISIKTPFDEAADKWRTERDKVATRLILKDGFEPEDAKREAARRLKGFALTDQPGQSLEKGENDN